MSNIADGQAVARFWSNVTKTDGCWPWTGRVHPSGYGTLRANGRTTYAHRFSYLLAHGEIPEGLVLDHLCHGRDETCTSLGDRCPHRRCVNPAHLEAVTVKENLLRGHGVGAQAARRTHCPQGHPYDEANTLVRADGHRRCRACTSERERGRVRITRPSRHLSAVVAELLSTLYPNEERSAVLERAIRSLAVSEGLLADSSDATPST